MALCRTIFVYCFRFFYEGSKRNFTELFLSVFYIVLILLLNSQATQDWIAVPARMATTPRARSAYRVRATRAAR